MDRGDGVSSSVLYDRLPELQDAGLVRRLDDRWTEPNATLAVGSCTGDQTRRRLQSAPGIR